MVSPTLPEGRTSIKPILQNTPMRSVQKYIMSSHCTEVYGIWLKMMIYKQHKWQEMAYFLAHKNVEPPTGSDIHNNKLLSVLTHCCYKRLPKQKWSHFISHTV